MIWTVMQKNVWKYIANLRIKRLHNYTKLQLNARMTINLKKKKMSQLENWLQFAHKLFWHVCIWLALGHLIFYGLWTNLLVRSQNGPKLVTNVWRVWTRTFIIRKNTGNIVMWETQHNIANLDCSVTLVLQETLKTQISTSRGVLCIFGSHTFVPISWTCKKTDFSSTQFYRSWNHFSRCRFTHGQYSRFHSPGFGDWSIPFRTEQHRWTQERATENPPAMVKSNMHNTVPTKHTKVIPTNIDHTPSNTKNSDSSAMYVFEDNEAVIKMIIKGRSPTMRHVSKTHRVAMDWLFDIIYLDNQIQIRYIDTKHTLADILTQKVISHVTNGTIFFICSTSSISAPLAAQRISAW